MKKKTQTQMLQPILTKSIKKWHKREHYQYQQQISQAILEAVENSQGGQETFEIPIEISRQAGKTTGVVDTVEFLLASALRYLKRPLTIGIFAPQKEQATTDFDRLKEQFIEIRKLGFRTKIEADSDLKIPEKWNSKTVKLYNGKGEKLGEVYIFPISKTSNPESKTLDLIIVEEAQDVDDDKMKNSIFPMGAATNAPRIYIGTAGTKLCYFKSQLDNNPRAVKIKLQDVFAQREAAYRKTGNSFHLQYQKFVQHEIGVHGEQSDYVQRQYFLKWIIGTGQFTSAAAIDLLTGPFGIISESKDKKEKDRKTGKEKITYAPPAFVGIDTAKDPDRTVVTVIRDAGPELEKWLLEKLKDPKLLQQAAEDKKLTEYLQKAQSKDFVRRVRLSQICGWLELGGTNYEDQFDIITDWLKQYQGIMGIGIDATGQGDFMPDKFERHTAYQLYRVKFGAESKDVIFKNLDQVIYNFMTLIPDVPMDGSYQRFRKQMVELLKEYKGRLLSVKHPDKHSDGEMGHDDYPDSWALAEYAKTEWLKKQPGIDFF